MATEVFKPDPSPESTSVDGYLATNTPGAISVPIAADGTAAGDSDASGRIAYVRGYSNSNEYAIMYRGGFVIDLSGYVGTGDLDDITGIKFYFKIPAGGMEDGLSGASSDNSKIVLCNFSPASNTALAASDYQTKGSTDYGRSAKQADLTANAYNSITLNAAGITAVKALLGSGVIKLMTRYAFDFDGTATGLTWSNGGTNQINSYFSDSVGNEPYLEITYTPPVVAPTVTTQDADTIATTSVRGNGNITATGGANATRRGFCYISGTSGDPTVADSTAYDDGDFGTGAYTKSITGLTAGTSYRVRAYAINSAGTSYGTTVQTATLSGPANLKTINGLAKASVKTVDGLAMASIKTYNGLN